MGVQGLTSYVEGNRHFFQDVKFRDSRLVIDGCSLYFRLYFNHGLDQQHGGDYDAFSYLLSQFLSTLAACNIQPYVVLDGGMDPSDKKFSTLRQRLQSKIKEAESLCQGHHGSILPLLTRDVFIQVLTQSGVPLVQCPAEADWDIACLARQWGCPVLSNDSDFYIFNLPGGYLPFRFFQWTNLNGKAPHQYISVKRYNTTALCRLFGGMNRELLPLCAVLAGNDYSMPKGTDSLLAMMDVSRPGGGRGNGSHSRIERVLLWLSSFPGPGEALQQVSSLMGETEGRGGRGKGGEVVLLSSQLRAGMQEYNVTPQSSLASWFSGDGAARLPGLGQLPDDLSWAAARGLLPPLVLDILVMRRMLLIPQVENSRLASSHCSARAIRQAIYGILLHRGGGPGGPDVVQGRRTSRGVVVQELEGLGENVSQGRRGGRGRGARGRGFGSFQGGAGRGHHDQRFPVQQNQTAAQVSSTGEALCVEEYDRLDLQLKRNQVEAHPPKTPIQLDTLGQAPLAARLGVLLDVLGVKETVLAPIPPHLKLAAAVTGFWLREASPRPSQPQLQALLLGMVYGDLCCNTQPGPTDNQHSVPQTQCAPEQTLWSGLGKLRVRPGERRGLDVGLAHCVSQWQACLWSALCLNQLLLMPLPGPHLSWLFSGSLVHGLYRSLKGGRPADSLLPSGPGPLPGQLYRSLLDAVRNCSSTKTQQQQHPASVPPAPGKKRRGGGGRGRRGRGAAGHGGRGGGGREGGGGNEQLNNRFALLMSEEEFEEEEDAE